MYRLSTTLAIAALAAIVITAEANAGGLALAVCGPRGTVTITNPLLQRVPLGYQPGLHASVPAPPQPFYKLQITVGGGNCNAADEPSAYYIPPSNEVQIRGAAGNALWLRLTAPTARLLRGAVRHLTPFPAPHTLESASVDRQAASHPSSYLRLYTVGTPTRRATGAGGWLQIVLTGPASPWSDGSNALRISRRGSYLERDGQLVRIPAALARRIRRGDSLS